MIHISDSIRAFASLMYIDLAVVERAAAHEMPNGSCVQKYAEIQSGLACRLSRVAGRRDDLNQKTPFTEADCEARLYCDPSSDIRAGDRITIFRNCSEDLMYTYFAGSPFCYPSHMEIPLVNSADV